MSISDIMALPLSSKRRVSTCGTITKVHELMDYVGMPHTVCYCKTFWFAFTSLGPQFENRLIALTDGTKSIDLLLEEELAHRVTHDYIGKVITVGPVECVSSI